MRTNRLHGYPSSTMIISSLTSRRRAHSKKSHQRNPEMFRVHTHNHECMQPTCINASIQTARVQAANLHACMQPNCTNACGQTARMQRAKPHTCLQPNCTRAMSQHAASQQQAAEFKTTTISQDELIDDKDQRPSSSSNKQPSESKKPRRKAKDKPGPSK